MPQPDEELSRLGRVADDSGFQPSAVADSPERDLIKLENIRRAMISAAESTAGSEFLTDRVNGASDVEGLWRLQDELMVLVSEHHEAHRAKRIVARVAAMFLRSG